MFMNLNCCGLDDSYAPTSSFKDMLNQSCSPNPMFVSLSSPSRVSEAEMDERALEPDDMQLSFYPSP
jgi:hypothetical protein